MCACFIWLGGKVSWEVGGCLLLKRKTWCGVGGGVERVICLKVQCFLTPTDWFGFIEAKLMGGCCFNTLKKDFMIIKVAPKMPHNKLWLPELMGEWFGVDMQVVGSSRDISAWFTTHIYPYAGIPGNHISLHILPFMVSQKKRNQSSCFGGLHNHNIVPHWFQCLDQCLWGFDSIPILNISHTSKTGPLRHFESPRSWQFNVDLGKYDFASRIMNRELNDLRPRFQYSN